MRVLGGGGGAGGVVAQMLVKFVKIYRNTYNGFIVWCVCVCVWGCMHV